MFFLYIKMVNKYQKHKESFKKKHLKDINIFLKKKKDKKHQLAPEQYTSFSE